MKKLLTLFVLLTMLIGVGAVSAQDQNIVEIAAGNPDFSTLVELVTAAGLVDALSGTDALTVFAPTNDAFAKLPPFVVSYLAANPDVLTAVLTYHVVPGAVMSTDLSDGLTAATLQGGEVTFAVNDMGVTVDGAAVTAADIAASNGVIHVIDTVILPAFELPAVDPLAVSGNIIAAGSSTVFPVTERMADLFNQEGFTGTITVDSIGSGAGYERFCVNAETDIANASRPIRQSEVDACVANNLQPAEFYIGIDALAIAVSAENTFLTGLTLEQLAQIFGGEVTQWNQIDPAFPAETIRLFSPGSDSGTYDYFVEAVFDEDETPIQNAPGIQFSEDDNVLVAGIEGSPYAIGYFGFAYYQENQDQLKAIAIEGIVPSEATGTTGEYPLSRPLFIYSAPSIIQAKPQVAAFINYYLQNANAQLGTAPGQIGYIPVNEFIQRRDAVTLLAALSN
ncbi:MAG TPA: phosphate ABC transporter substrate-binding protein PstS family protein [Aggregatilineales bacterium]|nr:phosphate ABC transporter substrate-binding protein PstS family protein [Aggregatilineales bacterium]